MTASLIGFAVLMVLILLRMPIAFAMGLIGFVGFALQTSWSASLSMVGQMAFDGGLSYTLSIIPLFIFMGNLITRSGLSHKLYDAAYSFVGHWRGGLAIATIGACGGFSAVCGSSLATAATMSKVAMPPMRRFGYADSLATGAIAAGGTLGILIPPSVILVIFGIMTETNIGALFMAGVIPGLLGVIGYAIAINVMTRIWPDLGPRGERSTWAQRGKAVLGVWEVLLLFLIIIGGIYGGIFTPTEAAGIGAGVAFIIAIAKRSLTIKTLFESLLDCVRTTAMIFAVLIGALIFTNFINLAGLPDELGWLIEDLELNAFVVLAAMLVIYIILGCVLESLSMILLTVPVFYPIIMNLDFGMGPDVVLIWFAIIVVVVTEISLITPPVGLNVYVLRGVLSDVKLSTIFRGVTPFVIADVVRLAVLVMIPALSLWLPSVMK
ncbi:TRAP transporter large permease [Granulosicoccus antarcticus]|uniref:TRAP transporter large permease protein n=1 Tax=Granulosicoccus antarcticus IMCC3135 TaxID=1192854 RepID=A0A2Z2P2H0_9GAMM|nr:TRAP transporter large permease [Granulosicoccus antarcticus]ASJ76821.1 C4-dicarboxylate TRAP transporter large permease protein DctM [Granulosicoccus antarcticus IMCC3135]